MGALSFGGTLDMQITVADLDNLRHMLGVSEKHPKGYRNYFVASVGSEDWASMERLRISGWVVRHDRYATGDQNACYHATLEGARAVGLRELPQ